MKVLLGTKNKYKIEELKSIAKEMIGDKITFISLYDLEDIEEPIENGSTFFENSLIKAKYYYNHYKIPVIADDSGIVVNSLNGRPGINSARYASKDGKDATDADNRRKLLLEMKDFTNRKAYFKSVIVYYDGNNTINGTGILNGSILKEETGENGFGYDSIFYVDELSKPLGLVDSSVKNKISHRQIAFKELILKIEALITDKSI